MSSAREWRTESKALDQLKTLATNARSFWQAVAGRIGALNLRFWYVLTFLIGAVITSALLHHIIYSHGEIPREGVRAGALMTIAAVAFAIARKSHRR
jgi:hypothetical protein